MICAAFFAVSLATNSCTFAFWDCAAVRAGRQDRLGRAYDVRQRGYSLASGEFGDVGVVAGH